MGDCFNYSLMVFEPVRDETSPPVNLIDAIENDEGGDPFEVLAVELNSNDWGLNWGNPSRPWSGAFIHELIAKGDVITLDDSWYSAFQDIQITLREQRIPFHLICHPKYEYSGELVVYHPDLASETYPLGDQHFTCDDDGNPYISSVGLLALIQQVDSLESLKTRVKSELTIEKWKELVGWI